MKKSPLKSSDPLLERVWPALLRAGKAARKLSHETGTPFYVLKDGRIIDLNLPRAGSKKKKS